MELFDFDWSYEFGKLEYIFIALFTVFTLTFLFRVLKTTRKFSISPRRVILKILLRITYFSLLIIALLGPSYGEESKEIDTIGKDIFFCVDMSISMNAYDVQPSRLEKVKFELKKVVNAFNSDRIGLIIFSDDAYLQCPLTNDINIINLFIQILNTRMVPNNGTDFGPPLKMALEKLNQDDSIITRSKSKIIVLISDGEDFGNNTDDAAEGIESTGIKLFTLGIGTEKGSNILTREGIKKDRKGKDVLSKLNAQSLKKLARITGGSYFEINNTRNDTERLISAIKSVRGDIRGSKQVNVELNQYYYVLMLALAFMCLDALISIKLMKI